VCVRMCVCVCVYIYIYIYVDRYIWVTEIIPYHLPRSGVSHVIIRVPGFNASANALARLNIALRNYVRQVRAIKWD
jgi:hypothetical protein